MRFCLYAYAVSPHLMPIVAEMVALMGKNEVRYIYINPLSEGRKGLGWCQHNEEWMLCRKDALEEAHEWLYDSDVLLTEVRDVELLRSRAESGRRVLYTSERWFKPCRYGVSGIVRMLNPAFFLMAFKIGRLFLKYNTIVYLGDGIYAVEDFLKVIFFSQFNLFRFFILPKLKFQKMPGGSIFASNCNEKCISQVKLWGYFVARSSREISQSRKRSIGEDLQILWVGRFLWWKKVETIIKAVGVLNHVHLDLYGVGPEEGYLRRLAAKLKANVTFNSPVKIEEVRSLMRQHDVYVLSSTGYEGWGAVVNEALEEGMCVFGTYEAGSSRTMLNSGSLYRCGDWQRLKNLLSGDCRSGCIGRWSVTEGARWLMGYISDQ